MSDYDLVLTRSKRLEHLLEEGLGATGRGLHEKTDSVASRLPPPLIKRLHFIATVRNKLVHDDSMKRLDDAKGYKQACDLAEAELTRLTQPAKVGCFGMIALILTLGGALAFLIR